jgi:hypothetical protein
MNGTTHFKKCKRFKNVNNCLNLVVKVLIYIQMLVIFSTSVLIRHLWQLKTVVSLHWCPIHTVLLGQSLSTIL